MEKTALLSAGIAGFVFFAAGLFLKPKFLRVIFLFLGIAALLAAGGSGVYEFYFKKIVLHPSAPAQQSSVVTPSSRRDKLTIEELTSELGLTEYQVKRIRPIMKEESLRRSALIKKYANGSAAGRQELQKELKLFREYYENMYSHVFSDAQFGQYKRLRDAHSPGEK
ncbi:MAG: hypothetical protein WC335_02735 [Candidatus Omnitrophota bacterium]|jgi:hypothetical protein